MEQLQRMCGHDVFKGGFWLPGFEHKTQVTLPNMLLYLCSHVRPEKPVMHEIQHVLQTQMANLITASSESNLPMHSLQNQLEEGLLYFPRSGLSIQDTLSEYEMVSFFSKLTDFGRDLLPWTGLFPAFLLSV